MKCFFADTLILLLAYVVAFLLRFDFGVPPWGWPAVLLGSIPALILGWGGLLLFQCPWINARAITLRNQRYFLYAVAFTVCAQLFLRYIIFPQEVYIVWRPPASVSIMAGILALVGLLARRYLHRLQLRPVEIADYLGRNECEVNTPLVVNGYRDKVVLITGAGGSIGSELAEQLLNAHPKRLILCDISEAALYTIHRKLAEKLGNTHSAVLRPVVADCGNRQRMRLLLEEEQPEIVFHAAAYKHVPMMELNPIEALRTNALGARICAEEAVRAGVKVLLLVSTDKAIAPISVLGVSKRLAELFLRDLVATSETVFCAVRFGNVLGSSGSVVPLFQEQIARGGPLTLTDPKMERYFVTAADACGLILQCALMAKRDEIFVLDMGERISITTLAENMICLAGLRPHKDIKLVYTGARPGEKLSEELGLSPEQAEKTEHPRIFVGHIPQAPHTQITELLAKCYRLLESERAISREDLIQLCKE